MESYLSEAKEMGPLVQALSSKASYQIGEVTIEDDRAQASVNIAVPDFSVIFADLLGTAFRSAFSGSEKEEIEKKLAEKYKDKEIPMTTKSEKFHLVKDDDGWKVFLDWKTQKIKKERQTKIQSLLAEAEKLKKSKKLHGAVEKYEQVLELDSEMVDAKEGLEETQKEIKSFEEKQAYIENVILYDLKAKYHKTYLDERVPGVEFKLKNKGNKALNEVEVTVYFKDAKGTIIAEEDYHPVLVTKYSFSGNNKPLKPNYVWQMERNHFYKAESVPTEWKEGAVSAKITNIEFAE
jgi:hypothetical protein